MSEEPTLVTAALVRYLAERTVPEDAFVRALKGAARAFGIPPIWLAPEQVSLVQILLRLCGAQMVVEVGTLAGSTAIAMAQALPADGRVHTIEIDPERAAFAAGWIARSPVATRVQVHQGAAEVVLPTFADGSAHAVLLDANKTGLDLQLREALRILRRGGLLLVDNAFAFGQILAATPTDADVTAERAFNDSLACCPAVQSVIVPLGDGLWVGVKL
jgi:caffeoyl-CoA O-methyltransferase